MTPGAGIFRTDLPIGFIAGGINCGVRRYRPDLGIIISEVPSVAAGVFTQNNYKAAPVLYDEKLLPADNIMAIITNSGQANAATGEQGIIDNQSMADSIAMELQCDSTQILTASTGVIGEVLSIDKITQAMPELIDSAEQIAERFALAIMTTDLVPKTVYKDVKLSQGSIRITGIAKGSGMIHPNMATMLGYLLSDVVLTKDRAQVMLTQAVNQSFNMISVDGETSTNDSAFLLANGASEIAPATTEDYQLLQIAFNEVATVLAKSIARDGEGATKLIEISVKGAGDEQIAKKIARSLTISPLIKTAIHGLSPNWGRIVARLGMEDIAFSTLEKCEIKFQDITVFREGKPQPFEQELLKKKMREATINITIDLQQGAAGAIAWGCDLSPRYVKINAEYLT